MKNSKKTAEVTKTAAKVSAAPKNSKKTAEVKVAAPTKTAAKYEISKGAELGKFKAAGHIGVILGVLGKRKMTTAEIKAAIDAGKLLDGTVMDTGKLVSWAVWKAQKVGAIHKTA